MTTLTTIIASIIAVIGIAGVIYISTQKSVPRYVTIGTFIVLIMAIILWILVIRTWTNDLQPTREEIDMINHTYPKGFIYKIGVR